MVFFFMNCYFYVDFFYCLLLWIFCYCYYFIIIIFYPSQGAVTQGSSHKWEGSSHVKQEPQVLEEWHSLGWGWYLACQSTKHPRVVFVVVVVVKANVFLKYLFSFILYFWYCFLMDLFVSYCFYFYIFSGIFFIFNHSSILLLLLFQLSWVLLVSMMIGFYGFFFFSS